RRHTRSKRDWSSDVCSSDLNQHIVRIFELHPVIDNRYPADGDNLMLLGLKSRGFHIDGEKLHLVDGCIWVWRFKLELPPRREKIKYCHGVIAPLLNIADGVLGG